MEIIPVKQEYDFTVMQHTMRAVAEHKIDSREISYYFDQKLVAKKILPRGSFLTDDDYIADIVAEYMKNNTGVYADIFRYHSDKVLLVSKSMELQLENNGIIINVQVLVRKEDYSLKLITQSGDDSFAGTFKATSFSEVLEKIRIFIGFLEGVSDDLTENIDKLSSDKVEEWIKWK